MENNICECHCHGNEAPASKHIVACCEGQCRHCGNYIINGLRGHERACPDIQRLRSVQKGVDRLGGIAIKMCKALEDALTYIEGTPSTVGREIVIKKILDALTP